MTRERRKWSPGEDALLRKAVQAAIHESRPLLWREIAKSVPGRSNKDCRRRWCNSLSTDLTKGSWTESEDERLWNAIQKHGSRWTLVAQEVRTRNPDQCSSHWSQTLNPNIDFGDWTAEDDETLKRGVAQHGTNWSTIASLYFPNRTSLAVRNRFNALEAKGKDKEDRNCAHRTRKAKAGASISASVSPFNLNEYPDDNDNDNDNGSDDDDDSNDDHDGDDEEDGYEYEPKDEDSEVSALNARKERTRPAASDPSWLHPSPPSSSSMHFIEPLPTHTLPHSSPFSPLPYTAAADLDLYPETSGWDHPMIRLIASGPDARPVATTPPGFLPDIHIDMDDGVEEHAHAPSTGALFYPDPPPTLPHIYPHGPGSAPAPDQSVPTRHRISIDVECTAQQLPQILNSVMATGSRVTMRLNHSGPE